MTSSGDPLRGHTTLQLELAEHYVDEVRAGRMNRRDFVRRSIAVGLSVPAVGALLAACGSSSTGASSTAAAAPTVAAGAVKRGGTLRIGVEPSPTNIDPLTADVTAAEYIYASAIQTLTNFKPDFTLTPALAQSWTVERGGREWTIKLRTTKWIDGRKFGADDVLWTLRYALDPKNASPAAAAFSGILTADGLEKVDAQTVKFHLSRPFGDLMSLFPLGAPILQQGYKDGDFVKGKTANGPFVLTNYQSGVGATMKKNPHYYNADNIYLDGLEFKFYDGDQPGVLALQSGEIDLLPQVGYSATAPLRGSSSVTVTTSPSSQFEEPRMRVKSALFADVRVRQALALSLDRATIVQTLFGDAADLGNDHAFAPVFPINAAVTKAVPQRQQDIAQAKALLAAAGHHDGVSVTLLAEQYLEIPQYAQLIQSQASAAGIHIDLKLLTQDAYYGSGKNEPWLTVPFGITDWGERGAPSLTGEAAFACKQPFNDSGWCNREYTTALYDYDGELDESKRAALLVKAAKIQHEQVPSLITYWIRQPRAIASKVKGVLAGPTTQLVYEGVSLA